MFFSYRQNNSGGVFDFDAERGISVYVIIEAPSTRVADAIAQDIGLYFDGEGDCPCCGDRWSETYDNAGFPIPSLYGTPVDEFAPGIKWMGEGKPEIFVHYLDGAVDGFITSQSEVAARG